MTKNLNLGDKVIVRELGKSPDVSYDAFLGIIKQIQPKSRFMRVKVIAYLSSKYGDGVDITPAAQFIDPRTRVTSVDLKTTKVAVYRWYHKLWVTPTRFYNWLRKLKYRITHPEEFK